MTKVNQVANISSGDNTHYLDTLAHLDHKTFKPQETNRLQSGENSQRKYQNRARAKAMTGVYLFGLIDLDSKLKKSYFSTYYCSRVILQDQDKAKSTYCKQRWCLVCNRVRVAKVINDYYQEISTFQEPYFMTLTLPNVQAKDLRSSIAQMIKDFSNITRRLKRAGHKIKLLRKYECTYNSSRNDYHPHFHAIVETKEIADLYIKHWLTMHTKADTKAQDTRPANDNSLMELCKYFTKIIAKDTDMNIKALDNMFLSVRNKRTFQAIGIRSNSNKSLGGLFDDLETQRIDHKLSSSEIYVWDKDMYDWISPSGETFADYTPNEKDKSILSTKVIGA